MPESCEQVHEGLFRNIASAHRLSQSNEYGMTWLAGVTCREFFLPLIKQLQRRGGVADFIPQIVGNAAIGVNIEEVLAQFCR